MLLQILFYTHHLTTLLFGVFLSAFFLGVNRDWKNIGILLLSALASGLLYLISIFLIGTEFSDEIYPFVVHLPLLVDPGILLQIPLASVTDFHSDGLPLLSIQQLGWNLCTHSHPSGMVLLPLQNPGNTYRIFPAVQISVSDHRPALREI